MSAAGFHGFLFAAWLCALVVGLPAGAITRGVGEFADAGGGDETLTKGSERRRSMPLRIIERGRHSVPVVICDYCGEEIKTADDGNYQWKGATSAKSPPAEVYFTHKKCCHAFDESHPAGVSDAKELDVLLVFLANNLKVDWEAAQRRALWMDQMG